MWRLMLVGVGYRRELASWIHSHPPELGCIEVTADHFFDSHRECLQDIREHYPSYVHGLRMSLGTPGKLDRQYLRQFTDICDLVSAEWVSEHIAFTRTGDVDLGHLNPIPYGEKMLKLVKDHVNELADYCQRPVILENITSHLTLPGSMAETEFINRLCDATGCGLLLDVTNLYVNSRNHDYDPVAWLKEIMPEHIVQLHVVGYSINDDQYEDYHAESIQPELWKLIEQVIEYAAVQAVILERDNNFPTRQELALELASLKALKRE